MIESAIQQIVNIFLTSLLTAFFLFLSLRWIFGKLINPLTHLGAKMAGESSGFNRASKAVTEDAAEGILNSPNIAGLKMIASQLGFDIDGMIEDHGAVETLAGITQVLAVVGINPQDLLMKGIGSLGKNLLGQESQSTTGNPYG